MKNQCDDASYNIWDRDVLKHYFVTSKLSQMSINCIVHNIIWGVVNGIAITCMMSISHQYYKNHIINRLYNK